MTGMFIKELMKKGLTKGAQKLSGQGKTTGKEGIKFIKPGTGLTTKRNIQDKTVKAVDEGIKKGMQKSGADAKFLTAEQKRALRQSASKSKREESKKLKGISYEYDTLEKKLTKAKADIKKRKKIKTAAGATAVGAGTAAAGLTVKKIKDKRDKKMGGGMVGRRMGYSQGSNGKIKFDAKKSDLDKSGSLSPYEKRRGMAIAKAMAKRKKKV